MNFKFQMSIRQLADKSQLQKGSRKARSYSAGQALITLLVFVIIAVTITTAAIVVIIVNSLSSTRYQEGNLAYYVAESGAENAILRLLRDPSYTGEILPVGSGSAVSVVAGIGPWTITSTGTLGQFTRKIQLQMTYGSGLYTYTNWREIP